MFTATRATTPMRPSTSHRTECVDDYPHSITSLTFPCTRILPPGYTHIDSFIFNDFTITILILHCSSVRAYSMHRRKKKQSRPTILTTTWSRNGNVPERSHPNSHRTSTRTHTVERDKGRRKGRERANTVHIRKHAYHVRYFILAKLFYFILCYLGMPAHIVCTD